jgi:aminoglycoside/choline kinase family phosphotransferase
MNEKRLALLTEWAKKLYSSDIEIEKASSDASFRSYYRIQSDNGTKIIMDAPPEKEPLSSFLDITKRLSKANINVPEIFELDEDLGFVLMSDLGKTKYLDKLNGETVYCLYTDALDAIHKMQTEVDVSNLKNFDSKELITEMDLFKDWFLKKHLNHNFDNEGLNNIQECFNSITKIILEIPTAFVHRDFHSRNLMITNSNNPGVLDYQDALIGPITYDAVSLLKDCYVNWDNKLIAEMLSTYYKKIKANYNNIEFDEFSFWFDVVGLQRHFKAIGIFSRLNYRDNKITFMQDIPRTYKYVDEVINKYTELTSVKEMLNEMDIKKRYD